MATTTAQSLLDGLLSGSCNDVWLMIRVAPMARESDDFQTRYARAQDPFDRLERMRRRYPGIWPNNLMISQHRKRAGHVVGFFVFDAISRL
jgi:hypothetical protein